MVFCVNSNHVLRVSIVVKNNKKWDKSTIIYGIAAALLFGLLFAITFYDRSRLQEKASVQIVMLGDSILGECRDDTSVSAQLSRLLGKSVFNGALGGTCMGRMDDEKRLAFTKDCLSMQALSQSIVTGDFGVQQTVRIRENATEYFEATINELESIDFEQVEILMIEYGINDYHSGIPIYDEEELYNPYTFTGALRSTLKTLQDKYPDLRIILLTPPYSWYPYINGEELTCEEYNLGGGVLEEYVNAEIWVAQSMGVEVIDLYHDFYPHEQWSDWEIYTRDGVHPNEAGRQLITQRIYEYLTTTQKPIETN